MNRPFWGTFTDGRGFASPLAPEDFPTREQAAAFVAALAEMREGTWAELERLTGIAEANAAAHRCFMVYGFPELEPATMARRMSEVFMRPQRKATPQATFSDTAELPTAPPDHGYGFTPRR